MTTTLSPFPIRRTFQAAGAILLAVTLASCSSDTTADDSAGTPEPAASEAVDTELSELLPDDIQEAGSVSVGTEAFYPPYEYLDTDGSTIIGFDIELLDAVTQRLGIEYELDNVAFDSLLPSLDGGRYDVVVAAVSDNAERQQNYDFVDYFLAGQAIIVPADNPDDIADIPDLCGKTVSVLLSSNQETLLGDFNADQCASDPIEILTQPTDTDALLQVQSGRAAASITQEPTGRYNAAQVAGGSAFTVANTETLFPTPLGYVFKKGETELQEAFQAALQSLVDDGTYGEILDSYEIGSGALETITINAGE